jgi:ABC-type polysaccharide/polyol phosphate export permease
MRVDNRAHDGPVKTLSHLTRKVIKFHSQSWIKDWPALTAPILLFALLPAITLFIGAGLILGIMRVINSDLSRITTLLLQYGIFGRGVVFPLGTASWVELLTC